MTRWVFRQVFNVRNGSVSKGVVTKEPRGGRHGVAAPPASSVRWLCGQREPFTIKLELSWDWCQNR